MLELIRWLIDYDWNFTRKDRELRFIYCNEERIVRDDREAKETLEELKADRNYGNTIEANSDDVKMFADKAVKPLVDELVDLIFDDSQSTCKVEDCHKGDDIQCGSSICIEENKRIWHEKVDELVRQFRG